MTKELLKTVTVNEICRRKWNERVVLKSRIKFLLLLIFIIFSILHCSTTLGLT